MTPDEVKNGYIRANMIPGLYSGILGPKKKKKEKLKS